VNDDGLALAAPDGGPLADLSGLPFEDVVHRLRSAGP
jgi:hypothetical protein